MPTAAAAEATAAPAATEANQVEPTAVPPEPPDPTKEPEPTAVLTEAPTEVPTKAPEPTKLVVDAEVIGYAGVLSKEIGTLSTALTSLGSLMQHARIGQDDWTIQAAAQVAIIRQVHQDVQKMDVPPSMQELHAKVLDATEDCDTSMVFLTKGIDARNSSDLNKSVRFMQQCSHKLTAAGQFATSLTSPSAAAASPPRLELPIPYRSKEPPNVRQGLRHVIRAI